MVHVKCGNEISSGFLTFKMIVHHCHVLTSVIFTLCGNRVASLVISNIAETITFQHLIF